MAGRGEVKRFESGAQIAWMLDLEGGYRSTSERGWQLAPLLRLPGGTPSLLRRRARVDLGALAAGHALPRVTVTPLADHQVRVSSEVGLVVQPYGETTPRRAGPVAEVPYGSVLRVGPLLFAVLYEEQAESLRSGTMALPFIGGGLEGPVSPEQLEQDRALARSARRLGRKRWRAALGSLALLATATAVVLWSARPTISPRRVLVVIEQQHPDARAQARAFVEADLERAGFAPVAPEGSACQDELSTSAAIDPCAGSLLAGQIVVARIAVIDERPGLSEGSVLRTVETTVEARALGAPSPTLLELTSTGEARSPQELTLAERGGDLHAVLDHEVIAALVGQGLAPPTFFSDVPPESFAEVVERRRLAERLVADWSGRWRRWQQSCEGAEDALYTDRGPLEVRYLTDACGQEYPLALTPGGREAILQVATARPYFTLSDDDQVSASQTSGRVDLLPLDGGPRRTLLRAHRLVGLGAYAPEAGRLYVVEQAGRRSALEELDLGTGSLRQVYAVDAPARIFNPAPAPDGSWVVLWRQREGSAAEEPLLLATASRETRPLPPGATGFRWLPVRLFAEPEPTLRLALLRQEDLPEATEAVEGGEEEAAASEATELEPVAPRWSMSIIDPESGNEVAHVTDPERDIDEIVGVLGDRLLLISGPPCALISWNLATGSSAVVPLERCLQHGALTGAGVLVATAVISLEGDQTSSDSELVRVDLETGALTTLTANRADERHPTTAEGTSLVAFGRALASPSRSLPRVVVTMVDPGR